MAKIKTSVANAGKDVQQLEVAYIVGGSVKWSLIQNTHLPYDPAIPPLGINAREKTHPQKPYTRMLTAAVSMIVKKWKQFRRLSKGK